MTRTIASRVHRGNLVRGSKEHVFKDKLIRKEIPKKAGIYALYNDYGLCYIGIAISLKSRITTHLRSKKKKWTNVSWYAIPKVKYIKDLETALIRITHPKYNKQVGKFGIFLGLILFANISFSQIKAGHYISDSVDSGFGNNAERNTVDITLVKGMEYKIDMDEYEYFYKSNLLVKHIENGGYLTYTYRKSGSYQLIFCLDDKGNLVGVLFENYLNGKEVTFYSIHK